MKVFVLHFLLFSSYLWHYFSVMCFVSVCMTLCTIYVQALIMDKPITIHHGFLFCHLYYSSYQYILQCKQIMVLQA